MRPDIDQSHRPKFCLSADLVQIVQAANQQAPLLALSWPQSQATHSTLQQLDVPFEHQRIMPNRVQHSSVSAASQPVSLPAAREPALPFIRNAPAVAKSAAPAIEPSQADKFTIESPASVFMEGWSTGATSGLLQPQVSAAGMVQPHPAASSPTQIQSASASLHQSLPPTAGSGLPQPNPYSKGQTQAATPETDKLQSPISRMEQPQCHVATRSQSQPTFSGQLLPQPVSAETTQLLPATSEGTQPQPETLQILYVPFPVEQLQAPPGKTPASGSVDSCSNKQLAVMPANSGILFKHHSLVQQSLLQAQFEEEEIRNQSSFFQPTMLITCANYGSHRSLSYCRSSCYCCQCYLGS